MSNEIVPQKEIAESTDLLALAGKIHIIDADSCKEGTEIALNAKRLRCKIEAYHKPHIDAANKTHKGLVKAMKELTTPLKQAEGLIKSAIVVYDREMERIRQEAAAKAQKEAEEAARKDRERLEAEALAAADAGDEEGFVEAEVEKEMVSPQDYIPIQAPKEKMPEGVSTRENWQAEVYDLSALIEEAHRGNKLAQSFIMIDMKALGRWAKATRNTDKLPGIRVWNKGSVSLRG